MNIHKNNHFNLSNLADCPFLHSLHLYGQPKEPKLIGNIRSLKSLNLWRFKKDCSLDFVNKLPLLTSLSLTLGGRANLFEVTNNSLKSIDLNQVRGLNNLSNLSSYNNLQELGLIDLAQIQRLDFPGNFPDFKKLVILNCKRLSQINGIENLSSLEKLLVDRINIDFDDFMKKKFAKTLKSFSFYTDKVRHDKEINEKLRKLGYVEV